MMLTGMLCKYCFDSIDQHGTLRWESWQVVKPIFVSFLIFGAAWAIINLSEIEPDNIKKVFFLLLIFFEHGFFWESAYKRLATTRTPVAS